MYIGIYKHIYIYIHMYNLYFIYIIHTCLYICSYIYIKNQQITQITWNMESAGGASASHNSYAKKIILAHTLETCDMFRSVDNINTYNYLQTSLPHFMRCRLNTFSTRRITCGRSNNRFWLHPWCNRREQLSRNVVIWVLLIR
jgi:hypothetical protein